MRTLLTGADAGIVEGGVTTGGGCGGGDVHPPVRSAEAFEITD